MEPDRSAASWRHRRQLSRALPRPSNGPEAPVADPPPGFRDSAADAASADVGGQGSPPPISGSGSSPGATLAGWLEVARPHLSAPLAGEAALARLRRAAERFPGAGLGALEIRLGRDGSGVVDLAFHLTTSAQAQTLGARLSPPHVARFLAAWARGEHPQVASLWLELDLEREPAVRPVPGICAALAGPAAPEWVLDRLLPALRGRALPPAQRHRLARCLAAILAPGRLLYAGSMESRGGGPVRLVVAGLDAPALAAYLGRVAPADVALSAAAAAALAAGAARIQLSFDVDDEVAGRVGWECSYPRLPSREAGWTALLARWTAAELATAPQRRALLAWPGYDSLLTAAPRWPLDLGTARTFCVRCLSHLKLISRPQHPPAAKAYLFFGPLRPQRPPRPGPPRPGTDRR